MSNNGIAGRTRLLQSGEAPPPRPAPRAADQSISESHRYPMSTTGAELAVIFFTICNAIRLVAAFQQLVSVMRDRQGAAAISCSSWFLFSLANVSTAIYAGVVLRDQIMTVLFILNALGTSAVFMATLLQRQRSAVWSRVKAADANSPAQI